MTIGTQRVQSDGHRFALVAEGLVNQFRFDWFMPEYWGESAQPVSVGGRGAAWFVSGDLGRWVLRKYYRGGLPGRFIKNTYLFLGYSQVRSIREYRLLLTMLELGLPVPKPIAACYEPTKLTYTAALILERLEGVAALSEFHHAEDIPVWQKAGACIREFHDKGVYHADLNCTNILVTDQDHSVYLIDFDRGRLHTDQRPDAPWKKANLNRLKRSVRKNFKSIPVELREVLLGSLLEGYRQGAPEAQPQS